MQMSWDLLKANKEINLRPSVRHLLGAKSLFCNTSPPRLSSALTGWAASVTFNPKAKAEFERFRRRSDTLSLGVCNGCQLLALLGWVGEAEDGGSGAASKKCRPKLSW